MHTQLALVSETQGLGVSELTRVSAALQKQVLRDLAPIWGIWASVDAFPDLDDVPTGYWPVVVLDNIGFPGASGIHLDQDGQPFALVQLTNRWTLTASHEVLEMLVDPFGDRLTPSQSIKPDQGRVNYLVEVCDPSEAFEFSYTVNGIRVSDFYTPAFFDPMPARSVRYSFTDTIKEPKQVLRGGYLSWLDPVTSHWWQQKFFGPEPVFVDLGPQTFSAESFRTWIDREAMKERREALEGLPDDDERVGEARTLVASYDKSITPKAAALRKQIEELKTRYGK